MRLLLLCSIALCKLEAQQVTFNQVLPPEGAIFGTFINGASQDPIGYMWFASFHIGLLRFDGYQFVTYSHDPKNLNSISSNAVEVVYADDNGMIWAGTQATGLDRFDPATGLFTNFHHDASNPNSLSNDSVTSILKDHTGDIWVGTRNGLNRLNQKTGVFTCYQQIQNDTTSLSDNRVQVLYEDRQGTIWIGTGTKQLENGVPEKKGGLNRFNRQTGNFTRYYHHPKDPHSLSDNRVGAIFEDSRGNFWVSTAGSGLHTMDRANGNFDRHPYDVVQPGKLSLHPPQRNLSQDLDLFFIKEDGSGAIWAGASGGWITRYDPKTKKASHYNSINGNEQ
jgi:ligand-binding sensor domain-containing protein